MSEKSIVQEARDIQLAMELITLGARLQMLESETQLSRGRLIKLYKELRGSPPPKGMLPFSTDFVAELLAADLSISMAGYNTCMDLLSTGVKAIVYPFRQNREQGLRARKFESLGLFRVIHELEVALLARTIQQALASPPLARDFDLNLAGARNTASLLGEPV